MPPLLTSRSAHLNLFNLSPRQVWLDTVHGMWSMTYHIGFFFNFKFSVVCGCVSTSPSTMKLCRIWCEYNVDRSWWLQIACLPISGVSFSAYQPSLHFHHQHHLLIDFHIVESSSWHVAFRIYDLYSKCFVQTKDKNEGIMTFENGLCNNHITISLILKTFIAKNSGKSKYMQKVSDDHRIACTLQSHALPAELSSVLKILICFS